MSSEAPFVVRACATCGRRNRIPAARLARQARCGACKAALPSPAEPLDVDAETFLAIVGAAELPVMVDFWAEWCGPCRMAAPHVAQVARVMSGRALVLKVDTEAHPALAERFHVRGIPNFVVLRGGSVVAQHAGLADAATMRRWLEQAGA